MTKTVGIIVIDREILEGSATDWNLNYVIQELIALNYQINKITAVSGQESMLLFEVEHFLKQNDFVLLINNFKLNFVYAALGKLFKDDLLPHSKISDKPEVLIPARSNVLEYNNSIKLHPVIYMNRLFLVQDRNLKAVFDNILKVHFRQFNKERLFKKSIRIRASDDVNCLSNSNCCVQLRCHSEANVMTIEAASSELYRLLEFEACVKQKFTVITSRDCSDIFENIYDTDCFHHIKVALECIEKCFDDYTPENVFLGFNGGKDCTVLLHLVLSVLKKKFPGFHNRLVCMYVQSNNPFKEVNSFIDKISQYYNLEIITITKGVKEGLAMFLEEKPHMKACLMGTRSTDPFSENLVTFQMTDPHWPQVMRVSPLLHWHYADIWDYLLYFHVPYCSLYDEGYTSLGSIDNTIRNPDLLYSLTKGVESYLPAYKLIDGSKERSGRQ